jgi:hypothetical protein
MNGSSVLFIALIAGPMIASCGGGAPPAASDAVGQALRQKVSVDWQAASLEEAADELSRQAGVRIDVDSAVVIAPQNSTRNIRLAVQGLQLRSVLHLILEPLDLGYIRHDDRIEITTDKNAALAVEGKMYAVADVTPTASFNEKSLADAIQRLIEPQRWEGQGGNGKCLVQPGALLISQTREIHDEIAEFLADLRQLASPHSRPPPRRLTPAEEALERALETRVSVDLSRPARELLDGWAKQLGFQVVIDEETLRKDISFNIGMLTQPREPALPSRLSNVRLATALNMLFQRLRCDWTVRDEVLLVTTSDKASEPQRRRLISSAFLPSIDIGVGSESQRFSAHGFVEVVAYLIALNEALIVPGGIAVAQIRRPYREIDVELDKIRRALDPRILDYDERVTLRNSARTWSALDRCVTLHVPAGKGTLGEILVDLLRTHGIDNIFFDEEAMLDAGATDGMKERPAVDLHEVTLATAVGRLLAPLGLSWVVQDDVVRITSHDEAGAAGETRLYRAAFVGDAPGMIDGDTCREVITSFVRPDSWGDAGGPGIASDAIPAVLVIGQTRQVHDELRWFLERLTNLLSTTEAPLHPLADWPGDEQIYEALERRVTWECRDKPVTKIVAELAARAGIKNVQFWRRSLEDAGIDWDLLDRLRMDWKVRDEPLTDALAPLLKPHGLGWLVRHNTLMITSSTDADQYLITGFYRLPADLLAALWSKVAGQPAALERVKVLLRKRIAPKSWDDRGGPGTMAALPTGLIVTQTPALHREVRQLLDNLQEAITPLPRSSSRPARRFVWEDGDLWEAIDPKSSP